jgi:hypothetical protein
VKEKGSMPFITDEEIADIAARESRATAGPWKSYVESRDHLSGSDFIMTGGEDIELTGATVADQDFIANARQDIPKLLAEIERLRKLVAARERNGS